MASGACKFDEEAMKEILDEPDCSNSTIVEDCSTLYLDQAGTMVEVDSDSSTNTIAVANVEPEDTVKLNSSIVHRRLNIGAGDRRSFMFVCKTGREGGEGWNSDGLVKPNTALDVHIRVRVVCTEFTVGDSSIRNQFVQLDIRVEREESLPDVGAGTGRWRIWLQGVRGGGGGGHRHGHGVG